MQSKQSEQKILLVDDDSRNLQVAMNILKDFNVIYAKSASKALELLELNDFDLILLDIVMPLMSGFEVCQIIKENEKFKNIPIVFLTVKDDEKDIVKGFELGAVDYITKPFYSAVLLKRVETHLLLSKNVKMLKNTVDEQVSQIRQKDKILFQQSKINELSKVVASISKNWKSPLGLIKMHMQSLELNSLSKVVKKEEIHETSSFIINLVDKLDGKISDFASCFKTDLETKDINIKVVIDSVLLQFKEELENEKILLNIEGLVSLKINIVENELKHILSKLIHKSIYSYKINKTKDKEINILLKENESDISIIYSDNSGLKNENELLAIFDYKFSIDDEEEGLGLFLTKIFVEKNHGEILVCNYNKGLHFSINFSKNI